MGPAELVQQWFHEVWDEGKEEAIDRIMAPDAKVHGLGEPEGQTIVGPEQFKHRFKRQNPRRVTRRAPFHFLRTGGGPSGTSHLYVTPLVFSAHSLRISSRTAAFSNRSTAVAANALAARSMPFWPIDIRLLDTTGQACQGTPFGAVAT